MDIGLLCVLHVLWEDHLPCVQKLQYKAASGKSLGPVVQMNLFQCWFNLVTIKSIWLSHVRPELCLLRVTSALHWNCFYSPETSQNLGWSLLLELRKDIECEILFVTSSRWLLLESSLHLDRSEISPQRYFQQTGRNLSGLSLDYDSDFYCYQVSSENISM